MHNPAIANRLIDVLNQIKIKLSTDLKKISNQTPMKGQPINGQVLNSLAINGGYNSVELSDKVIKVICMLSLNMVKHPVNLIRALML